MLSIKQMWVAVLQIGNRKFTEYGKTKSEAVRKVIDRAFKEFHYFVLPSIVDTLPSTELREFLEIINKLDLRSKNVKRFVSIINEVLNRRKKLSILRTVIREKINYNWTVSEAIDRSICYRANRLGVKVCVCDEHRKEELEPVEIREGKICAGSKCIEIPNDGIILLQKLLNIFNAKEIRGFWFRKGIHIPLTHEESKFYIIVRKPISYGY